MGIYRYLAKKRRDEDYLEWVAASAFDIEDYFARKGGKNGFGRIY